MSRISQTDIPFMKYRWYLLAVSMSLVGIAIFFLATRGLNFGTDFKGGVTLVVQFKNPLTEAQINDALQQDAQVHAVVQRFGEAKDNTFVVKSDIPQDKQEKYSQPLIQGLEKNFGAENVSILKEESVGPKVGKELRNQGIYAVIFAWIVILIYIGFRFDYYFAPGAIIALIHDVLISIGAFAVTGREVNLTVVAAMLTIIGYSINDTIIVFDRIREDLQRYKGMDLISLVDKSINETLMRTIITSLTVFFVSCVLFLRAEGDIASFGFAMIFGVITGTYSSVFIASPVFIFLKEHGHRFGMGKKTMAVGAKSFS